ncbi:hypothetical protein [Streptomyces sp. NRRL S-350]|uniref:hypothetical protein n=1 Tax=Streptomyces sp. NRRL S-350 TaxID=1463902 RepID=UPI0004BF434B|nr:hypothetical protein [Streptomyces sp. NRRL S-350]
MNEQSTMPEPLRRMVREMFRDVLGNLAEVLWHSQADSHDWRRMPGYRLTDAADTLNLMANIHAAYLLKSGLSEDAVRTYVQLEQGRKYERCLDSQEADQTLARMFNQSGASLGIGSSACRGDAPEYCDQLEALLAGWRAAGSEEDDEALFGHLPPAVADRARRIARALEEEPQPSSV